MGLDEFEALVHQPGGIDGDLRAHGPVGMGERLLRRRRRDSLRAPCAEWPPGGGQDHRLDGCGIGAAQRLEYGVVLAVHGQQAHAHARGHAHEGRARANQAFLVGQRDGAPGRQCRESRLDAGRPSDGTDHEIGGMKRGLDHRLAACPATDRGRRQRFAQCLRASGIGKCGEFRAKFHRHGGKRAGVAAPDHRFDLKGPRRRMQDHIHGRATDRACGAEQDKTAGSAGRSGRDERFMTGQGHWRPE